MKHPFALLLTALAALAGLGWVKYFWANDRGNRLEGMVDRLAEKNVDLKADVWRAKHPDIGNYETRRR
jgi:hypothetical protein